MLQHRRALFQATGTLLAYSQNFSERENKSEDITEEEARR